ncbi:hypothetical protein L6164_009894 [Bauhinia variegata]|uniref:Uncharacterized protein n=1 Tax=Bauhinia variegata TaxID=167791 RepID=A0ACB9PKJ4_BAUVA|nr:hypothetical protein L6164_009894 [Bauhinia variegata]
MTVNITSIKTSSDGAWQGDNPMDYAFPLLIVQTILVLLVSRLLAFLLNPLRQPKVIAEIIAGIVLGPSALGRSKIFMNLVFPSWSTPILESVASIGLLFFLFLVGLELDLHSIRRSGKRAFSIAAAGISLPFIFGVAVTFLLQKVIHFENHKVGYVQLVMFMGVSLSITAFPVLARILAELKLLTTQMGETAMAAAALNDVVAWILLALALALEGGGHKGPLVSIWVLFSGVAFVGFMLLVTRPLMNRVGQMGSREHQALGEACICVTLAGVMLSGFVTDLIGIHSIFGAFVFGLTIPKGEFAGEVTKRIEDFVSTLLLPLYFASNGLKTNVATLKSAEAWGILALVISTTSAGKILGTFVAAMVCMIPVRESLTLGFLMNTKGLVELIVLNIGREKKVLNDEMFTILVLMALFTTFITTPIVMAIYKPSRIASSQIRNRKLSEGVPSLRDVENEVRILACIHGPRNVPSIINLIESIRATKNSKLKLYVMHLVELTDRSSSILMVQRTRKNGFPFVNWFRRGAEHDQITTAFEGYWEVDQVTVHHMTAISALSTMHEDICYVAEKKRVAMAILPFHKWGGGEDEDAMENIGQSWRQVNQRVLQTAPCSTALLVVNRGFREWSQAAVTKRVCLIFTGGPDDRKVLELGTRMAYHPTISLTVVRFVTNGDSTNLEIQQEQELNEEDMADFKTQWNESVEYIEMDARDIIEEMLTIGKAKNYGLIIVGKGQQHLAPTMVEKMKDYQTDHAELGPIGDILSSSQGIMSSVLIVQDQDSANSNETTLHKIASEKSTITTITGIESSV